MRIAALLTIAVTAACAADTPDESFGTGAYEASVLAQLDAASQTLAAKGVQLKLVDFTPTTALDTDDAVGAVKTQILDSAALVPQYDGVEAATFKLDSIATRMQAYRAGTDDVDVRGNIESMAFPAIKTGQKALDVTWESQGRQFQTKLVYDDKGIVYDNMLTNLFVMEPGETSDKDESGPPAPTGTAQSSGVTALANQAFTTRFIDLTLKWIWGGTRGKIQIDHYVISCDNWRTFCDDGWAVPLAYLNVGNATAQAHRNALRKPRISKLAWGYAFGTPSIKLSVSFNSKSLTFSASTSGIGTSGHGAGIHTIF